MRAAVAVLGLVGCGRIGFGDAAPDGARIDAAIDAATDAPSGGVRYLQNGGGLSSNPSQSAHASFPADVHVGDTLIAAFDLAFTGEPAEESVTIQDTLNNGYFFALTSDGEPGYLQYLTYAVATADGSDEVTVTTTFDTTGIEVLVFDYAGIATTGALDTASMLFGSAAAAGTVSGAPLVTTGSDDLLLAFGVGHDTGLATGPGWTGRSSFDGHIVEDEHAASAGSYTPTVTIGAAGAWTIYAAAFHAAP